jgi:GAF domain-containing protein
MLNSISNIGKIVTELDIQSPPKEFVSHILGCVCGALGYQFGSVIEVDDEGQGFMFSSYNLPDDYPEFLSKMSTPLLLSPSGEAIRTGNPVVVADIATDKRMEPWRDKLKSFGIKTVVWIPLKSKGKAFGTYALSDTRLRNISDAELNILETLSPMISIAIVCNEYLDSSKKAEKKLLELAAAEAAAAAEKKKAEELEALNQQLRATEQQLRASEQELRASNQQLAAKEQALQESQTQLMEKLVEVERFNKMMVGRELTMIKLKEEINSLLEEMGKPKKY